MFERIEKKQKEAGERPFKITIYFEKESIPVHLMSLVFMAWIQSNKNTKIYAVKLGTEFKQVKLETFPLQTT